MEKEKILPLLHRYGVQHINEYHEIDTSMQEDYRLNIVIDRRYVLRINDQVMTEERLAAIDRLCERYRSIGVRTPRLYRSDTGSYLSVWQEHVCYLSEYLDYQTEAELGQECDHARIRDEVLRSIGVLSRRFTNIDLAPFNSMWSLIDLAPLDTEIDEKQENLNLLVETLIQEGAAALAHRVQAFNEDNRAKIQQVYRQLPRCTIQGDLNASNILVQDGHFAGLIDFNMAGTEVNVNHFCAETNGYLEEADFCLHTAEELYTAWMTRQARDLALILSEYELNDLETSMIGCYRNIGRISQYPNVMAICAFLKLDREKTFRLIELILNGESI